MVHEYRARPPGGFRMAHPRAAIIRHTPERVFVFDTAQDAAGHPSGQLVVKEPRRG